jgi:hypothetical protein
MLDFLGFSSLAWVIRRKRPRSFRMYLELINVVAGGRQVKDFLIAAVTLWLHIPSKPLIKMALHLIPKPGCNPSSVGFCAEIHISLFPPQVQSPKTLDRDFPY